MLLNDKIESALVEAQLCPEEKRPEAVSALRELLLPMKEDFAKVDRFDGVQVLFFIDNDEEQDGRFVLHQIACIGGMRIDIKLGGLKEANAEKALREVKAEEVVKNARNLLEDMK